MLIAYPLAGGADPAIQATASDASAPVNLTSEQDHQRILDLLHITSLRRGPDGDPKSPNAANFDESKVTPYHLPDGKDMAGAAPPGNRGGLRP